MQTLALSTLIRLDGRLADQAKHDLKLSIMQAGLAASGKYDIEDLYADDQDIDGDDDLDLNNPDSQYDYSQVDWQAPSEMTSDDLSMLDEMMDDTEVKVTLSSEEWS